MSSILETPTDTEEPIKHKPAFLKRVQIRNYKSIEFCDVKLEPLTVFIGKNGCGKSNFLDALGFLCDCVSTSIREAVIKRFGWSSIKHRMNEEEAISFKLWFHTEFGDHEYEFRLKQDDVLMKAVLAYEHYEFVDELPGQVTDLPNVKNDHEHLNTYQLYHLMSRQRENINLFRLSENIRSSGLFCFTPEKIRLPQSTNEHNLLKSDGRNLVRAIAENILPNPERTNRITQYLNYVVPEVQGFQIKKLGDNYETISFLMTSPIAGKKLEFEAANMSDGTLRVLATLVAAFQQISGYSPPGFIGIEEPETALHPHAMNALVDALDEATLSTQILISTHSAELIDNPTITPEQIRYVEMRDGKTYITPLDNATLEILAESLDTLGSMARDNQLSLNDADLKRQQHLARGEQ